MGVVGLTIVTAAIILTSAAEPPLKPDTKSSFCCLYEVLGIVRVEDVTDPQVHERDILSHERLILRRGK